NKGNELLNSTAQIIRPPSQLAIVPHASQQPILATPKPEPTDSQQQAMAQDFQGPTPSNHQEFFPQPHLENQTYHGPPMPPPPPPPQTLRVRPPPASIPQEVVQLFCPTRIINHLAGTIHTIILTRRKGSQTTTPRPHPQGN
ncbi:hypothetical protein PTTG_30575, partial [Puccinia triticina 1-1 BBBD Race 1]